VVNEQRLLSSVTSEGSLATRNFEIDTITANIEPCHWLSRSDSRAGLPYYLWDRTERRAVTMKALGSPEYLAISHTWGRWQPSPATPVRVPGVPWRVPVNTLFDVTTLPDLMERIVFPVRYIWFDLLCIPQEMSDPNFAPRAKIEIANQAAIFKSASRALAWLNWASKV
jgi:hypothetical protein